MRAEQVVHSLLVGSSALAALVSTRIYPGRIPQNTAMPCVAFELVSGTEIPAITANAGGTLIQSRVQVNVLGKQYADVKNCHEAIRQALLYQHGTFTFTAPASPSPCTVRVVSITRDVIGADLRDDQTGLFLQHVDYHVIHDEV